MENWGAGLVTRLLEVSHGQWLYWNVHVHDALILGDPALRRNEDVPREMKDQVRIGGTRLLAKEDMYLLEIKQTRVRVRLARKH